MMKSILKVLIIVFAGTLACIGVSMFAGGEPADGAAMAMVAAGAVTGLKQVDLKKLKIPEAEFQELKAKYGRLYVVDIQVDEDEVYQFIVRRPTRMLIEAVADTKDIAKTNDMIIKGMVVGGDRKALEDGLVYSALMSKLGEVMRSASGFLSKA